MTKKTLFSNYYTFATEKYNHSSNCQPASIVKLYIIHQSSVLPIIQITVVLEHYFQTTIMVSMLLIRYDPLNGISLIINYSYTFSIRSCYSPDRPANNSGFRYSPDEIYLGSAWVL